MVQKETAKTPVQPSGSDGGEELDFAVLRHAELEPWLPFLRGNRFASVVTIKGEPGAAELEGRSPFFGADGEALESALVALGWPSNSWCGVALSLPGRAALDPEGLRLLIETLDPCALLALDVLAADALKVSFGSKLLPRVPKPGVKTWVLGKVFVYVEGFEAALAVTDGGEAKRRVWQELKALRKQ